MLAASSAVPAGGGAATRPTSGPSEPGVVLRVARSADGLAFRDSGDVHLAGASAPAVVRLPNGHLLAAFDLAVESAGRESVLAVARSADEGRHWSRAEPLRTIERKDGRLSGRHGVFAWMADGWLRLYFVSGAGQSEKAKGRSASSTQLANEPVIRSAITRDGLNYGLDRAVELTVEGVTDPRLAVMRDDSRILLLVGEASCPVASRPADSRAMAHLVSRDGRRFEQVRPTFPARAGLVGSVVRAQKGFRAYCSMSEGIGSLVSADGVHWKHEEGMRLAGGFDPAAVQLADGTVLMLYCVAAAGGGPMAPLADAGSGAALPGAGGPLGAQAGQGAEAAVIGETEDGGQAGVADASEAVVWEPFTGESAAAGSGPGSGQGPGGSGASGGAGTGAPSAAVVVGADGAAGGGPGGSGGSDSTGGPVGPGLLPERMGKSPSEGGGQEQSGEDQTIADGSQSDQFPPKPDLVNPVDYMEWMKQRFPVDVEGNAWGAYDAFMPSQSYPFQENKPGWPDQINDMFNGEYNGPIRPWDPAQNPEWEATHLSIGGLLDQFREATRYERYACPLFEPVDADNEPSLISCLLPSLSAHRRMTRATMADAWRMENGAVQPDRMVDAMETCLRNANHMEQGYTLINHLVGFAEQALVQSNALKALQNNVFGSPEQMEAALNTLRQHDSYDAAAGASNWMPLEHAAALDSVQWMYPPGPDGQPALNSERARNYLSAYFNAKQGPSDDAQSAAMNEKLDRLAALNPDQVRQAVDILDTHFRELDEKWKIGYPQVRADDISQLEVKSHETNALTEQVFPSLARAYHLVARNEATRRATQLTYEVHLFKAHNGRWPASLGELSLPAGDRSRTDPFTGGDFGYRLGESGPTIYTLSENGRDDGAVHSENWASNDDPNASDDYVFWPPQK